MLLQLLHRLVVNTSIIPFWSQSKCILLAFGFLLRLLHGTLAILSWFLLLLQHLEIFQNLFLSFQGGKVVVDLVHFFLLLFIFLQCLIL